MASSHFVALVENSEPFSSVPFPIGKTVPFGWPAFAVRRGDPVRLGWRFPPSRPERLRLTFAIAEREHKIIEVLSQSTGESVGFFEVHNPQFLQTVEIELNGSGSKLKDGIALRVSRGSDPAWFFGVQRGKRLPPTLLPALLPHVLEQDEFASTDALAEFYPRLQGMASIQPFGWKAGAVFEGLWALSRLPGGGKARAALNSQIGMFVTPGSQLKYVGPRNRMVETEPHGLDALYPLSVIAQIDAHHPAVNSALHWLRQWLDPEELNLADGLYTAAFGAAVAQGRVRESDSEAMADWTYAQLDVRKEALFQEGVIWSRIGPDDRLTGANRMRAVAAFALGIARVVDSLPSHARHADWVEVARGLARDFMRTQQETGLWGAKFKDGADDLDLGASALVSLFLMTGARGGWLEEDARFAASRVASALRQRLTPDGLVPASAAEAPVPLVTPIPAGGFPASAFEDGDFQMPEPLQPHPTADLAPWAMGWMAATMAALA